MSEDFDPSDRPTKRRKTYAAGRSVLKSPDGQGALRSVSHALSGFSSRLFGRNNVQKAAELHDDSAYGSKEDSLNEDDIAVAVDERNTAQAQTRYVEPAIAERSTRRTTRMSTDAKDAQGERTATDATVEDATKDRDTRKSNRRSLIAEIADEPSWMGSSSLERSTRRDDVGKVEIPNVSEASASRTSSTKKRRKPQRDIVEVVVNDQVAAIPFQEAEDGQEEESVQAQPRSSGRERKKGTKFSTEAAAAAVNQAEPTPQNQKPMRNAPQSPHTKGPTSLQPKGILTPSSKRREGPRKSVVFHESEKSIEEQLGFKDIGSSSKKSKQTAKDQPEIPETPREPAADDEDDLCFDRNPPQDILRSLELPDPLSNISAAKPADDSPVLTTIKALILSRLTSSTLPTSPPPNLTTQYHTLHTLLTSTITSSESNSLLLLGSRGSGKSLLLNTALSNLSATHASDFHVVRLNGFIQTDDRLALREIWRQLGRERQEIGEVEEDETREVGGSYADTMASLLSLLSHPDEFEEQADVDADVMDVDAPQTTKTSKAVIIILDEFDHFTFHPRQTLLYNLFDIAQSKKAPIAVIGCSTRMDVVDCLEKRVKSRFSHRWVHVPGVRGLEGMREVLERTLCIEDEGGPDGVDVSGGREERERWNEYIKSAFIPSSQVQALLQQTFYTTKSIPDLLSALYIPIATLSLATSDCHHTSSSAPSTIKPNKSTPKQITKSTTQSSTATQKTPQISIPSLVPPSLMHLLPTLPTLHLALLISTARLHTIFSLPHLNFLAAYNHYLSLLHRSRTSSHTSFSSTSGMAMRKWSKDVCQSAWDDLIAWELLVPVVGGRGEEGGKVEGETRMVRGDVGLEEVAWGVKCKFEGEEGGVGRGVSEVLGRWCREE